jgi:steroid delta-isomerase
MPTPTSSPELAALVDFYEHLAPAALPHLAQLYHPEARFKDPFNDVRGTVAITRIFEHMFTQLEAPRFVVLTQCQQGRQAWLTWDFHFKLRAKPFTIHGASHLQLTDDGRVLRHRDYWDAAEELYAKLPLLGGLMRWLQRQLAAG